MSQDEREGCRWLHLAAQQGASLAQSQLGFYYQTSREKDEAKAVHWLRLAAEQGNDSAQYSLAVCYRDGLGVAQGVK